MQRPQVGADELFLDCVSYVRSASKAQRYLDAYPEVSARADEYEQTLTVGGPLDPTQFELAGLTRQEMGSLYKRMLPQLAPARKHRDKILAAALHRVCPYCGERRVESIDHYLPKSLSWALAVTPANLVPACSDCNHFKGEYSPARGRPALIHPYFEDLDDLHWLEAVVDELRPPAVRFRVADANLVPDTAERVAAQFELLRLGELYAAHAGQELAILDSRLSALVFQGAGGSTIRSYLLEEAEFRSGGHRNSWERVLFMTLADSDWYCRAYFGAVVTRT